MQESNGSWSDFWLIFRDALTNIVYILGVAIIEFWIRPLFGSHGVPISATLILLVSELTLLLILSRQCYQEFDAFVRDIEKSTTFQIITRKSNNSTALKKADGITADSAGSVYQMDLAQEFVTGEADELDISQNEKSQRGANYNG